MEDLPENILEMPVDPAALFKRAVGSDKVLIGYFEGDAFKCHLSEDMTYLDQLFALDTIERLIKGERVRPGQ